MSRENKIKHVIAMVLIVFTLVALAFLSSGAEVKKVYLKNGGIGDGSNYENAIGDFKEAVRLLAKSGGKIVVCGNYTFTELINLSVKNGTSNGTKVITVTSVDGEVDYRKHTNASLCFGDGKSSANMILAGKFVFENLNITTNGGVTPRAVVCNGYDTVFGEGIVCEKKGNAPHLSVIGISLDEERVSSNGCITIKSGNYYNVCAGNRNGNSVGNTFLTIDGGTFDGIVSASGYISVGFKQEGNASLVINGGTFHGQVGCITEALDTFSFAVNGGSFRKELCAYGKYNVLDINGGNMQNITAVNIADYIEDLPETTENGRPVETKAEDVKKSFVNINEYKGDVDKLISKINGVGVIIKKNTMGGNDAESTAISVIGTDSSEKNNISPEVTETSDNETLSENKIEREYLLGSRQNTVFTISVIGVIVALAIVIFAYRTVYRKK
ncbi:MAG: hypothetical protein IKU48_02555 [Clostridia bacterium]|nr:hypothetical protein [Clostridia bacterium]